MVSIAKSFQNVIVCVGIAAALFASKAHACEPAAFDFDVLMETSDVNHDGYLQRDELLAVGTFDMLDKDINTDLAFDALDTNHEQKISHQELWQWGEYTHNACAGWSGF